MGSFYTNHAIKTNDTERVVNALSGRSAFVVGSGDDCVLVFDQASDSQDLEAVFGLGIKLSAELSRPVWAVVNHDDDILMYGLFENGKLTDQYNSAPDYFDPDGELSDPVGGDAKRLATAFETEKAERIEEILRKSSYDEAGYIFASERHVDLAIALGLDDAHVNLGFNYLSQGDLPPGLSQDDLTRVG